VQYLAEAVRRLLEPNSVEVRLVGPPRFSDAVMRDLRKDFDVWGARPRSEIAEHYRWADVFVLPTLSEGSANVCYEAMAAGLPVITTAAAGSAIEDGKQGLIVPVRDASALVKAIERLAGDRELRKRLSQAAARHAAACTLQQYATRLKKMVSDQTSESLLQ
jgi:glycosyltransferase involved in cell wall biosynthesis